jgi:hypothetical protein
MKHKTLSTLIMIFMSSLPLTMLHAENKSDVENILAATKDWKPDGVFFLHIFDGYMSIPNRYQLNIDPNESNQYFTFVSPSSILIKQDKSEMLWPIGSIAVGLINKLPSPIESAVSGTPTEKFDCYGLSIEIRRSKANENYHVLFRQKQQFMIVNDENDLLWKSMLLSYGKLSGYGEICPQVKDIAPKNW